jgi:cellulose synthase operon protein YhjQ
LDDERRNTDMSQNKSAQAPDNDDVDGLYARVNLEGSGYRDFSQSREQARRLSRRERQQKAPNLAKPAAEPPISAARLSQMKSRAEATGIRMPPHPPEESPRWAALKHLTAVPDAPARKVLPAPIPVEAPVLLLFSFAGGVGKTTLASTLGRSLSMLGERVLLVETQTYSLIPLYFGAQKAGLDAIRTFQFGEVSPPLTLMTTDPTTVWNSVHREGEGFAERIQEHAIGMDYILIDAATGSRELLRDVLRLSARVLVVLTPDMASVVSLEGIQQFFQELAEEFLEMLEARYILNQFDPSLRLHLDVLNALSAQLGERLLPFTIHRSSAVSEALAEGMTVQQYAPSSEVVSDLAQLVRWFCDLQHSGLNKVPTILRKER